MKETKFLFDKSEWSFEAIDRVHEVAHEIAKNDLGLDMYPVQHEIIASDQMLEVYATVGLPIGYSHWSFGKHFLSAERRYRSGQMGLAYEMVLNSNPCIAYLMEENSMAMQTLVIAHASCGHNDFFKNNVHFVNGIDASSIIDYCVFARDYIRNCEERYGESEVEALLDAAHALMDFGVFRTGRKEYFKVESEETRAKRIREEYERNFNVLWSTLPSDDNEKEDSKEEKKLKERMRVLRLPEENFLYFFEKNSPILKPWQREVLRIVRKFAQYFYPQQQTKVMNEGWAVFVHYYILNELYEKKLISEGAMLEILKSHTNVIFQPDFNDPRFGGINPYALGFNIFTDIRRICQDPTEEDKQWFSFAGNVDWRAVLKEARASCRDESFITQYLSPHIIRSMRLFITRHNDKEDYIEISHIHDEEGYREVRKALANMYDVSAQTPNIQIVDVNTLGDRCLKLEHKVRHGQTLYEKDRVAVLELACNALWGYPIQLRGTDEDGDEVYTVKVEPDEEIE